MQSCKVWPPESHQSPTALTDPKECWHAVLMRMMRVCADEQCWHAVLTRVCADEQYALRECNETVKRLKGHTHLKIKNKHIYIPSCSAIQIWGDLIYCGGAWWVAIYGVAPGRTQLKRLSGSSLWVSMWFFDSWSSKWSHCYFQTTRITFTALSVHTNIICSNFYYNILIPHSVVCVHFWPH